jgi:hypothetical protein
MDEDVGKLKQFLNRVWSNKAKMPLLYPEKRVTLEHKYTMLLTKLALTLVRGLLIWPTIGKPFMAPVQGSGFGMREKNRSSSCS